MKPDLSKQASLHKDGKTFSLNVKGDTAGICIERWLEKTSTVKRKIAAKTAPAATNIDHESEGDIKRNGEDC